MSGLVVDLSALSPIDDGEIKVQIGRLGRLGNDLDRLRALRQLCTSTSFTPPQSSLLLSQLQFSSATVQSALLLHRNTDYGDDEGGWTRLRDALKYPEERAEFALSIQQRATLEHEASEEGGETRVVAGAVVRGTADPRGLRAKAAKRDLAEKNLSALAGVAREQEVREGLTGLDLGPATVVTAADVAASTSRNGGG
eukprot:CAMPEP_0182453490 /NCGR_PEP_ID=MMETSP1319-20130603/529_1 /TAXON_ID=172717 /ORGANISM="Bolidomonas pacifica, Strain RCC208" /LENGTH=196 /DNA_ID=CAMNT_0024651425 /DNA_START=32 /DNA_END=618 /DNA_ORIENTATION=+